MYYLENDDGDQLYYYVYLEYDGWRRCKERSNEILLIREYWREICTTIVE